MSTITLTDGVTTLALPGALEWTDRLWSPVSQSVTRGLTGKPIFQTAMLDAGRPITLQGGTNRAWVPRASIDQLHAWASIPGQTLTLNIAGQVFSVLLRHNEAPALDAKPIADLANPPANWPHALTLKLITRASS